MIDYNRIFSMENKLKDMFDYIIDEMGSKNCDPSIKFSSDYHLFRELRTKYINAGNVCPGYYPKDRTKNIIEAHNKYVSPDDIFVFLGDCIDDQLIEDTKNDYSTIDVAAYYKKAADIYKNKLNGKVKILLLGNNDPLPEKTYMTDFGFTYVIKGPIETGSHIFSHQPVNAPKGKFNIHGHIHYGNNYYNVDWHRHMKPTVDMMGHPVTMKEIYSAYAKGMYNGVTIKDKTIIY